MKTYSFNTFFVGKDFFEFEKLPSTNIYALKEITKNNPSEGTVISTLNQYDGRGQIGSKWESEPYKNISLSIILHPTFLPIHNQFELSKAVALAVRNLISNYTKEKVYVKWPNDIYVNNLKIGGILIQNSIIGKKIAHTIVGIGLNINQTQFLTSPPNPISLALLGSPQTDLLVLKEQLCISVEKYYLKLKELKFSDLHAEYLQHLYRFDHVENYKIVETQQHIKGRIIGVAPSGQLIMDIKGQAKYFDFKTIKFI